jgi:alpha/beta superfamily hydrolase
VARRIESLTLAGPAGGLEALLEEPDDRAPRMAAVVCHPHPLYGGTMHNKVVYRIARGLRRAGTVVLRFNFRGVGKSEGEHAHMTGEIEDARAALDFLRERYPDLPYALAGFSFGSRAIMTLGCELSTPEFLMALGFSTRMGSWEFLSQCGVPKIFIHSTHDEYGPRIDFERLYAGVAEPKRLIWIDAADHFFAGALDELEEQVATAAASAISGPISEDAG